MVTSVNDVLVIRPDGNIECLWTDNLDLTELGTLEIRRASNVEFDVNRQVWVAVDAKTGKEIAAGKNRSEVLAVERAYFNALS